MTPALAVVPNPSETVGERVRRLQAEAKALAAEHVKALADAMADVEALASEIASGGGSIQSRHSGTRPPGLRRPRRSTRDSLSDHRKEQEP